MANLLFEECSMAHRIGPNCECRACSPKPIFAKICKHCNNPRCPPAKPVRPKCPPPKRMEKK